MDDSLKKLKEDMQMLIDAGFAIPDMFEIDPKGAGEILISRDQAKLAEMVAKLKQKKERASRTDVSNAGGAAQGNKAKMMSPQEDVGRQVIDYVHKTMAIDEHWSVREPLGFTWWGHRLAQRVWAEPIPGFLDPPAVRVYAETALLRNVLHTSKIEAKVDAGNMYASLNAFIYNPASNRISVRCSGSISSETVGWMKQFFTQAVGIQVADAHIKAANGFDKLLEGEIDTSAHPQHGPRQDMDDMLNVIEALYAPLGRKPSPFTRADFEKAARMQPNPSVLSNSDDHGLTAEFPFLDTDRTHSMLNIFSRLFRRYKPTTALLTVNSSVAHPQLGSGAFWKLTLPKELSQERAVQIAADLNRAESRAETDPYLYSFGAWCSDPKLHTVSHVMFMPALTYKPDIIKAFLWSMALRAKWAREYLSQINLWNDFATKGDRDEATAKIRTALNIRADDVAARTALGVTLQANGDVEGAITEFLAAIRLKPDDAAAHTYLGVALKTKGDVEGAIAAHRTAIRLEPDGALAHYNLGSALQAKGMKMEAAREFSEYLRLTPDLPANRQRIENARAILRKIE